MVLPAMRWASAVGTFKGSKYKYSEILKNYLVMTSILFLSFVSSLQFKGLLDLYCCPTDKDQMIGRNYWSKNNPNKSFLPKGWHQSWMTPVIAFQFPEPCEKENSNKLNWAYFKDQYLSRRFKRYSLQNYFINFTKWTTNLQRT